MCDIREGRTVMSLHDYTDPNANVKPPTGSGSNQNIQAALAALGMMPAQAQSPTQNDETPEWLIDYNEKFKDADEILFRDEVIDETVMALIGQRKPNALLIGPAGVGKTAIAEEIARRLATDDPRVPDQLKDATVMELPLASLIAGGSLVGEIEKRVKETVDYASDPDRDVILFVDEIHQLMSDETSSYSKIAQILKPALARGDLRVIGATTTQESKRLMRDPAFSRRFSRVIVDEFTPAQTAVILESVWPAMSDHYKGLVTLNPGDLDAVVRIADELGAASQHRPDNAITLLDRACAYVTMNRARVLADADPQTAAALASQPAVLSERLVRETALKQATGHATPDALDTSALAENMSRIQGQDGPVERVTATLRRRDLHLFDDGKPTSMLFAGPSGVGKTEVARIISRTLFDQEPLILNMTEYANEYEGVNRLLGSSQGFIGSDWNNELPLDSLESNPYQVIVLDEFEKASRPVQRVFMGALEDGHIETALHKTVDFSHAIIIATTNASRSSGAAHHMGFVTQTSSEDADTVSDLKQWFDAELINRFGLIVTFNALDRNTYASILAADWARECERVHGLRPNLAFDDELSEDDLAAIVTKTYVPEFGARPAHRAVTSELERRMLEAQP